MPRYFINFRFDFILDCRNKFYFCPHLTLKNDMKALNILGRLFLLFMKKAAIGSKSFSRPIKTEEKQGTVHKVQIQKGFDKQKD